MTQPKRPLKVFLCHAHADRDPVRALYTRLTDDGVDAWLDKEKLLPGQDWELEIKKAVREADVVVVCLSKQFNQAGFRQKEVRLALDTANEKPEGEIFIIPARLEECDNLESLRKWHWVDLFEESGYRRLMLALNEKSKRIDAAFKLPKQHLAVTALDESFVKKVVEELEKQEEKTSFLQKIISNIRNFVRQKNKKSTRKSSESLQASKNLQKLFGIFVVIGLVVIFGLSPLIGEPESTPTVTSTENLKTFTPDSVTRTLLPSVTVKAPTSTKTPTSTSTPTATQIVSVFGVTKVSPKDEAVIVFVPASEDIDSFWIDQRAVSVAMFRKFVEETGYVTDAEKNGIGFVWMYLGQVSSTQYPEYSGVSSGLKLKSGVTWLAPYSDDKYENYGKAYGDYESNKNYTMSPPEYDDNSDVLQVSWNDAKAYCQWAERDLPLYKEWMLATEIYREYYRSRFDKSEWAEDKVGRISRVLFDGRDSEFVEYRSADTITFRCVVR